MTGPDLKRVRIFFAFHTFTFIDLLRFIMMHYSLILFLLLSFFHRSNAQLFPGLEGEVLVEAIREQYTPQILLNEKNVKDTLYARIFIQGDSLTCIYSGLTRFLPGGVDPSQFLYGNGNEIGSINLEHGWPQAKGAGEGTRGNVDMHHLYPSRVQINGDRANYPFMNINDDITQKWYYLEMEMNSKPINNLDSYSEFVKGKFEPRESVKGDIARAMFYFWTIYRSDAAKADPAYFEMQRENLCQWHLEDPADDFEAERNERIAYFQDNKSNPFIIDCTLARRAYCPGQNECSVVAVEKSDKSEFRIAFDPGHNRFRVISDHYKVWKITVFNLLGQPIYTGEVIGDAWSEPLGTLKGFCIVTARSGLERAYSKYFIP